MEHYNFTPLEECCLKLLLYDSGEKLCMVDWSELLPYCDNMSEKEIHELVIHRLEDAIAMVKGEEDGQS